MKFTKITKHNKWNLCIADGKHSVDEKIQALDNFIKDYNIVGFHWGCCLNNNYIARQLRESRSIFTRNIDGSDVIDFSTGSDMFDHVIVFKTADNNVIYHSTPYLEKEDILKAFSKFKDGITWLQDESKDLIKIDFLDEKYQFRDFGTSFIMYHSVMLSLQYMKDIAEHCDEFVNADVKVDMVHNYD